jgi:hypothetical protein
MPHDCAVEGHDYQFGDGFGVCKFCRDVVAPPGKIKNVPISHINILIVTSSPIHYRISFLHLAVCFEITLYLSSHFPYTSVAFRKIAQAAGGQG